MASSQEPDDDHANTMRILLATDCHLGYMEKDAERGQDSLRTFEEILQIAKEQEVDFILLGGDLFHDNKPSRWAMHSCMSLLRSYCMGSKPCEIEFLSDQSINFGQCKFPHVNYEDPNLNISMPVFSIHGNHDDPSGLGNLCALDLLSSAGLVNYFGKVVNLEQIVMSPILLSKGASKLALYGLGSIRDERLHRLFLNKQVKMLKPREESDDWFHLLTLHQNRTKHSEKNWIPEQFLDNFLNLIFWGHEHECKINPVHNDIQNFYVTQPGSSVATSLSEGETREKHVGLLKINKNRFQLEPIPLKTVRPFYMEDIILSETSLNPGELNTARNVENYCIEKCEALIRKAAKAREKNPKAPEKPLIRLRIDYSGGFEMFHIYRFGQKFVEKVANPNDIIHFMRARKPAGHSRSNYDNGDESINLNGAEINLDTTCVEDMLQEYFTSSESKGQLNLLSAKGMSLAVKQFVEKEDKDAIDFLVKYELDKTQQYLKTKEADAEEINDVVTRYRKEHDGAREAEESLRPETRASMGTSQTLDSDVEEEEATPGPAKRGRGRGRGRGSRARGSTTTRGGTSTTRGKKRVAESLPSDDEESDRETTMDDFFASAKKRGRRR